MIFVPLPFVVALLLGIVLVQMLRRADDGLRGNLLFFLLIVAYAVQSILIGLRWGYDLRMAMPLQPVLAAVIASLAWLGFKGLAQEGPDHRSMFQWLNALPTLIVILLLAYRPDAIDLALTLIFTGYGAALLHLAWKGPDALVAVRLDGVVRSHRALQVTAVALLCSALSDIIISLDAIWSDGRHAGAVVAFGNVLALLILGGAASVAGSGQSGEEADEGEPSREPAVERPAATQEDAAVAASVDALMQSQKTYKDANLNLGRLARKLRLPTRQVSLAINRVHGMSVSQYVNNYRVREACRLLETTDEPVTRVMFDAGFLTKSNFNREFLRVTATSPKVWRQRALAAPGT